MDGTRYRIRASRSKTRKENRRTQRSGGFDEGRREKGEGRESENNDQFLDPASPGGVSRTPLRGLKGPCS